MATPEPNPSQLLVLGKVKRILGCFTLDDPSLTLQEIRTASSLPASTCQRLVANMVREGFLDRDDNAYRIGLQLVRWSAPGTQGLDLVRITHPVLARLRDATSESACLFVRDGPFRTLIGLVEARHALVRMLAVGMVMPLHAGTGRTFMAFDDTAFADAVDAGLERLTPNTVTDANLLKRQLDQARDDGYVVSREERDVGIASVSAPVFNGLGDLVAVIGIGAPNSRLDAKLERLIGAVVDAAADASSLMGRQASPR